MDFVVDGSPLLIKLIWKIIYFSFNNSFQYRPSSFLYTYATCLASTIGHTGLGMKLHNWHFCPLSPASIFFIYLPFVSFSVHHWFRTYRSRYLIILHGKDWRTRAILFSGKIGKHWLQCYTEQRESVVFLGVGMEEDEVGEEFDVIQYASFLASIVFLSKLTPEDTHLPYITFFSNLGQHWAT